MSYLATPAALVPGNRVALLKNGAEAYPRMLQAIRGATHSILLEMYTFASDKTGWTFARAMADRAKAGVQVRILYDGVGCQETSTELWSHLRLAGAAVTPFRPPGWYSMRRRDHRKMLVVDGRFAFAGGLNIADAYVDEWRDTQIELEGPVAGELCRLFQKTWETEEDDPLWRPDPPPRPPRAGEVPVAVFSANRWLDRRSIGAAYLHAIRAASTRIRIANAYFTPGLKLLRALRRARKRGVEVTILVPGRTDAWPVYYASRYLFARLLKAGVRIFEWQGSMFHAKTAVVDGLWSTVGSYNLDHLSLIHNQELAVVVEDPSVGREMDRAYEADMAQAREIDLPSWKRRPLPQRFLEWFWHLFQSTL